MTSLKLYNTLTKEIEELKPIKHGEVGMYHCGPTVYDYLHIGNMRVYVFADTLRRTCEYLGYTVKQVINITDVGHLVSDADEGEDKMEKGSRKHGKSAAEIAQFFTNVFFEDLAKLNIETISTQFPKATEYIDEQIALVQELEKRGHTYTTSDGVYFDVSTWKEYGKLGQIDLSGLEAGKRVAQSLEKHTDYDFALWKFSPQDEQRQQEWESPWGKGFPGWHIECSAMSMHLLGKTFDIHTGGIDHIPVHHNNEIAQSESITGKPLANIWMHGAFLNWKDRKMSKSDGSFVTLSDLEKGGISPLTFRYFLLQSKYRQPIFFDMESLVAAQTAYTRLKDRVRHVWNLISKDPGSTTNLTEPLTKALTEDLNTAEALAYIWEVVKEASYDIDSFKTFIEAADKVLGLKLSDSLTEEIQIELPANIQTLIDQRNKAKTNKDWNTADALRTEIENLGYEIADTKDGVKVTKK